MRQSPQEVPHEPRSAQATAATSRRAASTWSTRSQTSTHERDSLLALPGAPLFRRRIAAALLTAIEQRKPMAIVAVHLGDARDWQDVSGPAEVRTVLATYATRLARSLHSRGMLNRSAVYDFSAAVEHIHGEADFAQQLQSLHRTLMEPIVIGGRHVTIRPFIGVAICPFDGLTAEALTKRSAAAARLAQHDAHEIRFFGASDE